MKTRVSLIVAIVFVVAATSAWSNRRLINAYFTHTAGAPAANDTSPFVEPEDTALLRFAIAGDVGTGGVEAYRTSALMDELEAWREFDALLLLGDNVYENGDPADVGEKVLEPFGPVLDGETLMLAVLGNHDVRDDNGPAQAEALGMPGRWYATEIDTITILSLDSTQASNPEQRAWLESTLASVTTQWTIVTMHHPPFSAGWHGNHPGAQTHLVPLFEEHGVDIVFSGHDHDYQRSTPINGVTYVVTGAAAKLRATGSEDFTVVSWSTHNFVDLVVYPDRLEAQAIDHDGRVIDAFTVAAN